ncbi:MAG: putative oxidoreductase [Anaerolineaceae bacterium]|nr:MAG: putative oxidoreductase [Anaerolineaceae bacterium]
MPETIARETLFLHNAEMGLGAWAWGDRTMWNYGHGYTDTDIEQAFQTSLAAGVNLVDTAEVYGSGRSERFLGQFVKAAATPVLTATKFMPFPWRLDRGALMRSLDHSLERLGLERVDLYQIHWPFPPMPVEFWVEELAQAVKSGKTRTAGVSNYNKTQMQRAYTILSKYDIPLASNQVEYHLLNRTVEKNGLLDRCKELGVRLIAYSPLAKGLLTGKYSNDNPPPGLRARIFASALKDLPKLVSVMTEIGQGHGGKTPGQVALNWLICKGALPIPGAKNARQAEQNAGAIGWRLTPEEVQSLDEASDQFTK